MSTDHMQTIRDLLTGQGLNTPDSEIYPFPLAEEMANQCISMAPVTSQEPESFFEDDERWKYAEIQVRLRAPADKIQELKNDSQDVYDLIDNKSPSGYIKTVATRSNEVYIGPDGDGRHSYTIQPQLWIIE